MTLPTEAALLAALRDRHGEAVLAVAERDDVSVWFATRGERGLRWLRRLLIRSAAGGRRLVRPDHAPQCSRR